MEWVAFIGLIIVWRWAASRQRRLETKLEETELLRERQESAIAQLTQRIHRLESREAVPVTPIAAVETSQPAAAPPVQTPMFVPLPPKPYPLETPALPLQPETPPEALPEPVAQAEPEIAPSFSYPEPLPPPEPGWMEQFQGRNWESIIGTSWLNALGVLIVVVGVSLFLGYAITEFGPLGKIAIGTGASLAMLLGGLWFERKETYVRLGRGLAAAGWASLYFTAFAAHGLPEARVIESPVLGLLLLLAISCGMIAHSLRYRSQSATLVAYASAYLALQLTPASAISLGASIPMAISMLTLSRYFGWETAPLAAMLLTYLTFAYRFADAGISSALGAGTLYTYWLAFEIHDLLKLRAAAARSLRAMTIFPLNALLLLATAMLTLPPSNPIQSSNFLATAGIVFAISTVLRRRWEPAAMPEARWSLESVLQQSHRIALSLAAVLIAGSILRRFSPMRSVIGLMLEGQLIIFIGLRLGDTFFRNLGGLVLGGASVVMAARNADPWRWLSLALSAQYYGNRWLTRSTPAYTWGALLLLLPATGDWVRQPWFGPLWIAFAVVLHEVHRRTAHREFYQQTVVVGFLGFVAAWIPGLIDSSKNSLVCAEAIACGAALLYFLSWRIATPMRSAASLGGTLLMATALWLALPAALVAPAWGILALILLEGGFSWDWLALRRQSYALALTSMGWLFTANFPIFSATGPLSHRLLTVVPVVLLAWHFWRRTETADNLIDRNAHRAFSWAGIIVTASLLRFELGRTLVVLGWTGMMLAVLHYALRREDRDQLLQAYGLAALIFFRAWATNFASPETLLAMPARIAAGVIVAAAFYAGEFRFPREWKRSRMTFALAGSALLGILLYYEVSGRMLTIAWGAEAVALLIAGFARREQVQRITGLAFFAVCVAKLFFYDLSNLDTLSRILAFIVMGLVLLGASSLYMRFEKRINETPQPAGTSES